MLMLSLTVLIIQCRVSRHEAQRMAEYEKRLREWREVTDAYSRAYYMAQNAVDLVLDSGDVVIPEHSRVFIKYNRDAHDGATEPLPELLQDVPSDNIQRDAGQSGDDTRHTSKQS